MGKLTKGTMKRIVTTVSGAKPTGKFSYIKPLDKGHQYISLSIYTDQSQTFTILK